jgi:hypothetical protein
MSILKIVTQNYRVRLYGLGIPLDPVKRSPDQQSQAVLEAWAAALETSIEAAWLDQSELEK